MIHNGVSYWIEAPKAPRDRDGRPGFLEHFRPRRDAATREGVEHDRRDVLRVQIQTETRMVVDNGSDRCSVSVGSLRQCEPGRIKYRWAVQAGNEVRIVLVVFRFVVH